MTAELIVFSSSDSHAIAALLGHTNTKTSEVYTKGAERWKMAAAAMRKFEAMDWWCVPRSVFAWDTLTLKSLIFLNILKVIGAGSGNRTRIFSLEGCCTTIVLYPQCDPSHSSVAAKCKPKAGCGGTGPFLHHQPD